MKEVWRCVEQNRGLFEEGWENFSIMIDVNVSFDMAYYYAENTVEWFEDPWRLIWHLTLFFRNLLIPMCSSEMMPPVRKVDGMKNQGSPKLSLSKSAGSGTLQREFQHDTEVKLSSSCFGAIRTGKDDDLTSLNWLQKRDILKGFDMSSSVPPMSPPHDGEGDFADLLLGQAHLNGDSSPDGCTNRKKSPSKPPYSFSSLIFMAIEESAGKRLPVKDIYSWIMEHFPYFRDAPLGWKNSVRHNLSLNKCFKKVDKDRGQVGVWFLLVYVRHNFQCKVSIACWESDAVI